NEAAVILLTEQGYIKRMPVDSFEAQRRATRGRAGAKIKEDDAVEHFLTCCDHDNVLFFSDRGVVYSLSAYKIPTASRQARGVPIVQMLPIPREERITSMVAVSEFTDDEYLVMLTREGYIKKTALSAFSNIRTNGLIAISLADGDQLRWVRLAKQEDSIIIGSSRGMAIHFKADDTQLRPLGRATRGVKAMKLRDRDELISMDILPALIAANIAATEEEEEVEDAVEEEVAEGDEGPWILAITSKGFGKRIPVTQFRLQKRAGLGLRAIKFRSEVDCLVGLQVVHADEELMLITNRGIIIRQAADAISLQSRMATGVRVQRLDSDDAIAAVALVPASGEEDLEEMMEEDLDSSEEE
ncbi:MAG: DNA gyrase subunit A, partial [Kamptonema sp. SIO4C4]|nr:DNA gyrase subunit A [Kamptonema sp. SIO4C4]